jgi:hypothetical protein
MEMWRRDGSSSPAPSSNLPGSASAMPTMSGRDATNGSASGAESFAWMRAVRSGPCGAPRAMFASRHTLIAASSSSGRMLRTFIGKSYAQQERLEASWVANIRVAFRPHNRRNLTSHAGHHQPFKPKVESSILSGRSLLVGRSVGRGSPGGLGPSADLLGQLDDDSLGAPDVAEPVAVLVAHQLADELGAAGS